MNRLLQNEAETASFAAALYQAIGNNACQVHLSGDLGVGKTTLVRAYLRAAGYTGLVKSPTFTLVEEYDIDNRRIIHFDLYRISDEDELEWIGLRDYLVSPATCFIEWPQRAPGLQASADICIELAQGQTHTRTLSVQAVSNKGLAIVSHI